MYDLLIQDVLVVDPQTDRVDVLLGHDILVRGRQIVAVQPTGQVAPHEAGEVIDAAAPEVTPEVEVPTAVALDNLGPCTSPCCPAGWVDRASPEVSSTP